MPAKGEGFDAIDYAWQKEGDCAKILKDWVLAQKATQRVEDLQPGASFKEAWPQWQKTLQEWRKRQQEFKDPIKRKALAAKKKAEAAKKKEADKPEGAEDEGEKEAPEEEAAPMDINVEELDVFTVEDIMDLGNCEPLFANFAYEDWTLLSTRYEIHLLLHSFKKDLNDADRPSFGEKHLAFYYNKYYRKQFSLKMFNFEKMEELVEHIKDTVTIAEGNGFLLTALEENKPLEWFVKLAEEQRRDRQRRLDAGDETAKLKFQRPAAAPPRGDDGRGRPPPSKGASGKGSSGGSRVSYQTSASRGAPPPRYGGAGSAGSRSGAFSSAAPSKRPYTPSTPSYSSKYPRTSYGSDRGVPRGDYYRR